MTSGSRKPAFIMPAGQGAVLNELGHTAWEKVTSEQTGGAYYVFELTSPPGLGIPPHVHSREDEVIFILDGEFEVFLDGTLHRATSGSTLNFARGTAHAFRNIGSTPGRTLWLVTPGASFQAFFRKLGQIPPGPPDPAKVGALFAEFGMEILPPS